MKIQVAVFLLVLLSGAELSEALDFFHKHVVQEMSEQDCNRNMESINNNLRLCKKINTFFFDPDKKLKSICSSGQLVGVATSVFKLINCEHDQKSIFPKCLYEGETDTTTTIQVKCENGIPVHLMSEHRRNIGG